MPRTTQKTAAKRPPPRPRPRRKLAASETLHSTLVAVKSARRDSLAIRAAAVEPRSRRRTTWLTKLEATLPSEYRQLVAMATSFANGGKWRDVFGDVLTFYDWMSHDPAFATPKGQPPIVSYQTFRVWLRTLEDRS